MRFKAPNPTPPGFARRMPPSVFPPLLGLFGLGLAWRRAAAGHGLPAPVGETILGAVTLLFLAAVLAYLAKIARRPPVVAEELKLLPGRLGLSAAVASLYLLSLTLSPYAPDAARQLLLGAFAVHAVLILLILLTFLTGPAEQRRFSAAGHLYFVSPVIGAMVAAQAGYEMPALVLLGLTTLVAIGIWAWGADRVLKSETAPALRPLLAIHLAPAAVCGLAAQALGLEMVAQIAAGLAMAVLAGLVIGAPKLVAGGFSPLWGAMTFPLAATASLWIVLGGSWMWPGLATLAGATLFVPWVAYRVVRMWLGGQLAVRTNAASA